MKKAPKIWELDGLVETTRALTVEVDGKWIPCRPMSGGGIRNRIKATWLVWTGKADAVIWPSNQ